LAVDVEAFYQRYGPLVYRRCKHLLRDEDRAMDAMQEVFVKVLAVQDRLDDRAPSGLLYRMATQVCLNQLRTLRRHPEDRDEALLLQIAALDDAEGRTVAERVLEKLFQREQPSTRTIAVLHLLDGLTLEEVAQEVGLSVSGVRKRLRTLRAHVEALEERG
jgi:RNA polymerase sigma-70 factor (ECF subfamily)